MSPYNEKPRRSRGKMPKIEPYGNGYTFRFQGRRYTFGTQKEAELELLELMRQKALGRSVEHTGLPFELAAAEWLKTKHSASYAVREGWQLMLDNHLLPVFAGHDLGELTDAHINEYVRRKLGRFEKGEGRLPVREVNPETGKPTRAKAILSTQTVVHHLLVLRGIFAWAERKSDGRIRNIVLDVERPTVEAKKPQPLEREDVAALFELMPPEHHPLTHVMLNLGLRISEALGLELGDYDSVSRILSVRQQLKRELAPGQDKARVTTGALKTGASEADFLLSEGMARTLDAHIARLKRDRIPNPKGMLFPSAGEQVGYGNASGYRQRVWLPAVTAWHLKRLSEREQAQVIMRLPNEYKMVAWLLTLPHLSLSMVLHLDWDQLDDRGLHVTTENGRQVTVPVPAELRRRLEQHRESTSELRNKHNLICVGKRSWPHRLPVVAQALKDAMVEVGLAPEVTPHALRHTFVSELIFSGEDLVSVSSAARHARKSTTADRYAHQFAKARLRPVDTFELYQQPEPPDQPPASEQQHQPGEGEAA